MRNYIAVLFDDTGRAYKGLHALWELDHEGEITVHGTAVVHRDQRGEFRVDTKETNPALATAVGVGVGALLGALAGPVGAAVGAAGGAGIGAAAGSVAGVTADLVRAENRGQAAAEARLVVGPGQSAVIADVSEASTSAIDTRIRELGGIVRRRAKSAVQDDAWFYGPYFYPTDHNLYPYEYIPGYTV